MKNLVFIIFFLMKCLPVFAQEKTDTTLLEKRMINVQLGVIEFSISDEFFLKNAWSLRTEIAARHRGVFDKNISNFGLSLQPRWYYKMRKRVKENRNTVFNASDFFYTKLEYIPNWVLYSNNNKMIQPHQTQLLFGHGFRANLGKKGIHFEMFGAVGLQYYSYSRAQIAKELYKANLESQNKKNDYKTAFDFAIRIGYSFRLMK